MKGEKANVNRAWDFNRDFAAVAGAIGGFFIARRTMMEPLVENPPFDEDMIRSMMIQMGQNHLNKVRQIAASMKAQAKKELKSKIKIIGDVRFFS